MAIDKRITELTEDTAPTIDDFAVLVDSTTGLNKKALLSNLLKILGGLTPDTAPTVDDLVLLLNDPSGTPAPVVATLANLRSAIIGSSYLQFRDEQAQNTEGGTFTSGAWRTRVLNTEVSDVGGLGTLSSNQITLAAGTYLIQATAPAYEVDRHQLRLQNVTDATTVLVGQSNHAGGTTSVTVTAHLVGIFTIGASKALELQHQCTTTKATSGFGLAANFTTEVYAVVELWRIG